MTLPPLVANLLEIHTDDVELRQKGRLVQILILILSGIGLLQGLYRLFQTVAAGEFMPTGFNLLGQLALVLLFCAAGLVLVRNGRPTLAAHLFFILLNFVFFLLLIQTEATQTFPYLMLISIIAIATMDSVKASIIYTVLVILSVSGYFLFFQPTSDYFTNAITFALVTLSISTITWVTASRMQRWLRQTSKLSQQLEEQTNQLQHQTQQLQRSALVSQSTSDILNLDDLLKEIVYTIRDQYGFYFVAIYLLSQTENSLILTEASGAAGEGMKNKGVAYDIDETSILSWAVQNKKPKISHHIQTNPPQSQHPVLKESQSEAAIPLIAHGNLLGVLDVQSDKNNAFADEEVAILQILANQLATNIANARLFSQTETHLEETQSLLNFNSILTSTMDVGEIYRRAARTFSQQLNGNLTIISNWNPEDDVAVSQIIHNNAAHNPKHKEFVFNPLVFALAHFPNIGQVLKKQTTITLQKGDTELSQPENNFFIDRKQEWCLILPLTHGSEPIGCITIFRTESQPKFTNADIQLAQVMSNETAIAINNAMLASEARGQVAQLSALNRLSNRLSLAPTMHDIFKSTQQEVFSLFEATTMSIMLLTPDEKHYQWIYAYEYGQELDLSELDKFPISRGFSGQVIRTRRRLLLNKDLDEKIEQFDTFNVGVPSAAWLGVPLIVANKIIGVLAIENEQDSQAFDERSVQLLETIAGSTAIAISNQLTLTEIQAALKAQSEQRVQLQTAAEVSAVTNSILDLNKLLEESVSLIKERFTLYYTGVFLIDPISNQAVLRAATGEAGKIQLENGHKLTVGGRSLIGGATNDGRSRIIQDVTQDEEWQPNVHLPDTRSELALPLRVRGEIIGALTVQSTEPNAFSPELVSILQTMSDQLAIAIDNSRLLAAAESRVQRQRVLNKISTQIHNTADTDEIIRAGLKAISEQVNGRSVKLFLGQSAAQSIEDA